MIEVRRNPLQTSKEVFESAGVPDVPKLTGCRILRRTEKCGKREVPPSIKGYPQEKEDGMDKNYMKLSFQTFAYKVDTLNQARNHKDGHRFTIVQIGLKY